MMHDLRTEIQVALNRHSAENGSNTPDFILADFLMSCLSAFDRTTVSREEWGKPAEHIVSDTEDCWCEPTVVKVPR